MRSRYLPAALAALALTALAIRASAALRDAIAAEEPAWRYRAPLR